VGRERKRKGLDGPLRQKQPQDGKNREDGSRRIGKERLGGSVTELTLDMLLPRGMLMRRPRKLQQAEAQQDHARQEPGPEEPGSHAGDPGNMR
jgi:hypothetical protein